MKSTGAPVEVQRLESRQDGFADDAFAGEIVQGALQPVAHLDADSAVVLRDDQDRAVIDSSAAELPFLRDPQGKFLDFFGCCQRDHQHGELTALPGFERCQRLLQGGHLLPRERAGLVGDMPGQRWHRHLRRGKRGPAERECQQQRSAAAAHRQAFVHLAAPDAVPAGLAGAVSNPTLGGFEMSFSFSTAKLAFSL